MQHPLYNKVFPIFDIFRFEQNKNKAKQKRMNEGMEPRQHTVDDMKERRRWWVGWGWWCGGEGKRTGGGGWTADGGLGSFSHRRTPPGKMLLLGVCVCARVWSSKKHFQPNDGYETRGERQWLFHRKFTRLSSAALKASSDTQRHFHLRTSVPCPARRRQPESPSHIAAVMQKKRHAYPRRPSTHGDRSN